MRHHHRYLANSLQNNFDLKGFSNCQPIKSTNEIARQKPIGGWGESINLKTRLMTKVISGSLSTARLHDVTSKSGGTYGGAVAEPAWLNIWPWARGSVGWPQISHPGPRPVTEDDPRVNGRVPWTPAWACPANRNRFRIFLKFNLSSTLIFNSCDSLNTVWSKKFTGNWPEVSQKYGLT